MIEECEIRNGHHFERKVRVDQDEKSPTFLVFNKGWAPAGEGPISVTVWISVTVFGDKFEGGGGGGSQDRQTPPTKMSR